MGTLNSAVNMFNCCSPTTTRAFFYDLNEAPASQLAEAAGDMSQLASNLVDKARGA
jgi:hypothetical protein